MHRRTKHYFRTEVSDLWPSSANRENVLGELISAKLVGKDCQGTNSLIISQGFPKGVVGRGGGESQKLGSCVHRLQ